MVLAKNVLQKEVFVTGGTGSIGQALVRRFCGEGAEVTFQYFTNAECARQLEKECGAKGFAMDFAKDGELPPAKFEVVVNNAAINITSALSHEVTIEDWERTIAVNLTFSFRVIKQYLPGMIDSGWGRIVNISSIYGLRATENNLPYNVSKHGLSALTKTTSPL